MRQVSILRGELDAADNRGRIGSIFGGKLSQSPGFLFFFRSQFGSQAWWKKPGFATRTFRLLFRSGFGFGCGRNVRRFLCPSNIHASNPKPYAQR